jgi:hypothetical protein
MAEGGIPHAFRLLRKSAERVEVEHWAVDVRGVFVERVSPPNSNDIKQSRESAFPYPLVFVSLPSPTIVDPKVKFFR